MKDKKKIKKTAQQISKIEKKYQQAQSKEEQQILFQQLEKITENLSLAEMLQIDAYILENNLLN